MTKKPDQPLSKQDFETLSHFRYQLRRFLRFSEEATRRCGITPLQYLLLLHIRGFPGRDWATVGELAERLQAKHHGVVSLILRCEQVGLVNRSTSRLDRRRVEVRLTKKGAKHLEQLARMHRAELLSLQGDFTVPDMKAFSYE
ncbi:MAG: MarR family transcriptional regulator [Candidatus Muproteobacteria bacterium RBG_16_60_9]|uniref:MarR family transcriptional regulator n=1 Tax=Candidatus Muproteobacteria bacterium RBG_16_60_9 TaxID=1817755 RepID=A0A1F6UVJ2_9PROT|nr:MAG: MarR family transcriptional regulator [Candidatus Muproteobacteria bacterium RBG_16_60_9]